MSNNLGLVLPSDTDNKLEWGNLNTPAQSFAIHELALENKQTTLVIASSIYHANQLYLDIEFYSENKYPVILLPDWETLPYDHFSPHQDIISSRLKALYQLPRFKQGVMIISISTLMHRLCPIEFLEKNTFMVSSGEKIDLETTRNRLIQSGYRHVDQVIEHGEFCQRGSILDIFPMGSNKPFRLELFDDEIDTIRCFDPETQRSTEKINSINLLPAREFPLTDEAISFFRQNWRERFTGNPAEAPLYQQISKGEAAQGIEYFLPLFHNTTATIFDYLPQQCTTVFCDDLHQKSLQFWEELTHRHEQLRYDITRPLCSPCDIFIDPDTIFAQLKSFQQIKISNKKINESQGHSNASLNPIPPILINHKLSEPCISLRGFITDYIKTGRVLFCTESTGRREALLELRKTANVFPVLHETWGEFIGSDALINILVAPIHSGFILDALNISVIAESDLFGKQVVQQRRRQVSQQDPNAIIRNLTELRTGAAVVHLEHGIGRYLGLQTITTGGYEAEYLTLEYAGGDKVYVPVSALHLISRYGGADQSTSALNKLGSPQWQRARRKAAEEIRDVAAELLDIYGQRKATKGHTFNKPDSDYQKFRNAFPFEETPDQHKAINDVINDMVATQKMERLVCGDVGFGKTEVAMQASFLATQSNKQICILVPTTLLAQQHGQNFKDRFADWPIKIATLSRLTPAKEQQHILNQLESGSVDIVIGTHKLLSEKIKFKRLGLLIVDEEHRFGVRQKDRIKSSYANVDILTLTATPIPRTLNMSMAGIRDLSIIATPPVLRVAVKTFVQESSSGLIKEAIMRETMRGGQVYYLHNDVATINAKAENLREIAPEARIAIAHGQMRERELEQVMSDFYHQRFNVLLCSTIIESGIDVPTANTIIIDRADKFGLAQLHQLRGRVGRSHHQAYAYLLAPPYKSLTSDAKKRLDAIAELGDLGVGFSLATHDLEIRGAGELLGDNQSGHIQSIGFSLYMELLDEAVKALKSGQQPALDKPLYVGAEINLGIPALLPQTYIADVHTRLILYKRLSSCKSGDEMRELKTELIDRFGLLPASAENLFEATRFKLTANKLGIKKIEMGKEYGHLHFEAKPKIDPAKIIQLIQQQSSIYRLLGTDKLRFKIPSDQTAEQRFQVLQLTLNTIT